MRVGPRAPQGTRRTPCDAEVVDPKVRVIRDKACVDAAVSRFGALHLAINNAGIGGPIGLLADQASFIAGSQHLVDGGYTAQ